MGERLNVTARLCEYTEGEYTSTKVTLAQHLSPMFGHAREPGDLPILVT